MAWSVYLAEYATKAKCAVVNRPKRITITNELGNAQTLPDDKGQFEIIPGGPQTVFLGLGPAPGKLVDYFPRNIEARYIEHPEIARQIEKWDSRIPATMTPLSPEAFTPEMAGKCTIIRYRPGLKAFPSFWGPLTARTATSRLQPGTTSKSVWLPLGEADLLSKELTAAFEEQGYTVRALDREQLERSPGTVLPDLLQQETPELFLSVNFKGLEPFGLGFNLLREAGVPVAIWLVDNPFNILTSVKSGYWKEANLFVTDHSFIGPLMKYGASHVTHLPLATSPRFFDQAGTLPDHAGGLEDRLVFVGRSEFPGKNRFFAGLTPNQLLLQNAVAMLDEGERPHFHWWEEHIRAQLWPGNKIRHVGIGAEVAGYTWKVRCLSAAGDATVIFGDDKWSIINGITADTRPFVDYYAHLPAIYRTAAATLNITGLQLPAGLTQRHFDVWAAGGFLLTDNNPGLKLFPEDLCGPTTFRTASEIPNLFAQFKDENHEKSALRDAWRQHILNNHTYVHRITTILETIQSP